MRQIRREKEMRHSFMESKYMSANYDTKNQDVSTHNMCGSIFLVDVPEIEDCQN